MAKLTYHGALGIVDGYPLVICYSSLLKMIIEIVDLP